MAEVIYTGITNDAKLSGSLFNGIKFWLSQRVPQRSRFIAEVKANGGEVVLLDKQADVMIVDHARKEALPGTQVHCICQLQKTYDSDSCPTSYSYTFIERSIRNGHLEDMEDHKVGPALGTVRSIGSSIQPSKTTRSKFTEDDDRVLWNWVYSHTQKGGGTDGNEIYKQLEVQNSRHPWQSWRDRWIKHLKGRPPPALVPANAPPTPPSDHPPPQSDIEMSRRPQPKKSTFSNEDAEALLEIGEDILNIHPERIEDAWEAWASKHDTEQKRPAQDWRNFWEINIRPVYIKRRASEVIRAHATKVKSEPQSPAAAGRASSSLMHASFNSGALTTAAISRSPSLRLQSPNMYSNSPSLPIRSPLKLQERTETHALRSCPRQLEEATHPRPETEEQLSSLHSRNGHENVNSSRSPAGAQDPRQNTLPVSSPVAPPPNAANSPKRKRLLHDDDELPSSSPPGLPLPRSASPKRRRQEGKRIRPLEIASTTEKSPRRPNIDPQMDFFEPDDEVISIPDDDERSSEGSSNVELESLGGSLLGRQASPTLSSPSRAVPNSLLTLQTDTQAVFEDPTQFVDFDIPDPDEGWDDEFEMDVPPAEPDPNSQLVDLPPIDSPLANITPETQPPLPDTQALLDSKTQILDLEIAEPDGGWDTLEFMPSSPPTMPGKHSSPPLPTKAASPEPQKLKAGLNEWIGTHLSAGYSLSNIIAALKATSNDLDLAKFVLNYMARKGKGRIPSNEKGIWTEDDDEDLESTHARRIEKVQAKHGEELCDVRLAFLHLYRQSEKHTRT